MASFSSAVALSFVAPTLAIDKGLGLKPPVWWRSWNLFGANVNQSLIESVLDEESYGGRRANVSV